MSVAGCGRVRSAGKGWAVRLAAVVAAVIGLGVALAGAAGGQGDELEEAGCWDGRYVAEPAANRGLVADCRALLAIRDYWLEHPDNRSLPADHFLRTWEAGRFWTGVTIAPAADGLRVTRVDFASGDLGGGLPAEFGNLTGLERLYLNDNRLTGPIPAALGNLADLENLQLQDNQLTGAVPDEIVRLPRLERLRLAGNQLSGPLPAEERMVEAAGTDPDPPAPPPPFTPLDAAGCSDGTFVFQPASRPGLVSDCRTLVAIRNYWLGHPDNADLPADHPLRTWGAGMSWDGVLLAGAGGEVRVDTIALPWWNLRGGVPSEFGELDGLRRLFLNHNLLTGPIPAALGNLDGLTQLHLNSNELSGPLPEEITRLTGLTRLALFDNRLTGPLPPGLGELTDLVYLDLDRNRMSGPLPAELGNLVNLTSLWLRGNGFTGPLPDGLGNMADLRRLHIADNDFSGPVPESLTGLAPSRGGSLAVLDACRSGVAGSLPPGLRRIFQNSYFGGYCDDEGDIHEYAVSSLAGWGIEAGCDVPAGFCPKLPVDRAQTAAYLYEAVRRLAGPPAGTATALTDVPAGAPYRRAAQWAVSAGVMDAPGGRFNPAGAVTRGELAVMMTAAFPHLRPAEPGPDGFADLSRLPEAAARAAEGLRAAGVTRGCGSDPLRYCPGRPVTRGQLASFLFWAIDAAGA